MVLNHIMGLYVHPKKEWQEIGLHKETLVSSLTHLLFIALIPTVCAYIANTYIGWDLGISKTLLLTPKSALLMSVGLYAGLIGGVFALAYIAYWMAKTFDTAPSYSVALELVVYTATPMFMVGLAALYPTLWLMMMIGLCGIAYSIYLLYSGLPIMMNIPEDKGFMYASSVVTAGLVLLVSLMATSIILWSHGFGPVIQ
ncbi:MAG: YIP1 family protein [Aliivibrio sp.]|uniref:Yip1 family protein n=1 Tax=Aliivibrio sp. TaxID=1872443 RepID=UPI001A584BB1|nr:YIP1 family protein [Aliivibrio sp.]